LELDKKETKVGMGNKTEKVIQDVEEKVHYRTNLSNFKSEQKNKNKDRYIRLCNKRGVVYGMQR